MPIFSSALVSSDNSNTTNGNYHVKLIGFGKTRMVEEVQVFLEDCDYGYQAPEVVLDLKQGPSADIWSLGCVVCIIVFCLPGVRLTPFKDF